MAASEQQHGLRRAADSMAASDSSTLGRVASGMKLSSLVTRATRPVNPASASAVMTASDTPPVRRVSSATSTRPVTAASRRMSVHRQRREPAQVQHPAADPVGGQPGGHPQAHPQAVAERDDGQVAAVAVAAGPGPTGTCPAGPAAGGS